MQNILFVCTGNTCRSPMAAAVAIEFFTQSGLAAQISSCGVYAWNDAPASQNAISAMSAMGLDLSTHSARRVNREILGAAGIIITLTAGHKTQLLADFAEFSEKIFTFGELCGDNRDIPDPFGGDMDTYLACASDIKNRIETIDWRTLL